MASKREKVPGLIGALGERYKHATVIENGFSKIGNDGGKRTAVKIGCDCGNELIIFTHCWTWGLYGSCGKRCLLSGKRIYDPRTASAKLVFAEIQSHHRGDLSFEDFLLLSQQNCHYCGGAPKSHFNKFGQKGYLQNRRPDQSIVDLGGFTYNGVDRIDSLKLHDTDNVVPCCIECNQAKWDRTQVAFAEWILNVFDCWATPFTNSRKVFPTTAQLIERAYSCGITIPQKLEVSKDNVDVRYGSLVILSTYRNKEKKETIAVVRCDCGTVSNKNLNALKRGGTKSCSRKCPYASIVKRHPMMTSAGVIFFNSPTPYDDGDLSLDQFFLMSQLPCWYCGELATNSNKSNCFKGLGGYSEENGSFLYNGLDRIDNAKKHVVDNVVPCCYSCNIAKNDQTVDEFSAWVMRTRKWAVQFLESRNNEGATHQQKPRNKF